MAVFEYYRENPVNSADLCVSSSLRDRFNELNNSGSYQEIKSKAESKVVTWRWASRAMRTISPHGREFGTRSVGRWFSINKERGKWLHGIDRKGQVVVIRELTDRDDEFYETYFADRESELESIEYHHFRGNVLLRVMRLTSLNGQPRLLEQLSVPSCSSVSFHFEGHRLASTRSRLKDLRTSFDVEIVEILHYGNDGEVSWIERFTNDAGKYGPPQRSVNYKRLDGGQSTKQLAAKIEEILVREIPLVIARASSPPVVFDLLLVYDAENFLLPPRLALGPESLRQRARSEHGKNAKYHLWNPADYETFGNPELELEEPELLETCDLLNQQMSNRNNCQPAIRLLNSVAAQLQKFDWTGILHTTEDFVVSAVDLESQDDLQKNIKKSVPPELIKRLKREGML